MPAETTSGAWSAGKGYEDSMGRWSRMVAAGFLGWLDAPTGADWMAIGCGIGFIDDRRPALKARLSAALGEDCPVRPAARTWAMKAEIGG